MSEESALERNQGKLPLIRQLSHRGVGQKSCLENVFKDSSNKKLAVGNLRSGQGEGSGEKAEMGVRTLLKKVAAAGRSSLRPELENIGSASDHKNALLRGNKL